MGGASCGSSEYAYEWDISVIVLSAVYCFIFCLTVLMQWNTKDEAKNMPLNGKVARIMISFAMAFKGLGYICTRFLFHTSNYFALRVFLAVCPGYVVDIAYLLILISWCSILIPWLSNKAGEHLQTIKTVATFTIPVTVVVVAVVFCLEIFSSSQKVVQTARSVENVYVTLLNILIASLFTISCTIMSKSLGYYCGCSFVNSKNVIHTSCVYSAFGLIIRFLTRVLYEIAFHRSGRNLSYYCSLFHLYITFAKESFGIIFPMLVITLSDWAKKSSSDTDLFDDRSSDLMRPL